MRYAKLIGVAGVCAGLVVTSAISAKADAVSDFYKGESIKLLVGARAGGGNDVYGRLLARHMGGHIPGKPKFIVQNKGGAGGLVAGNVLYAKAPRDGSIIGMVTRVTATDQLIRNRKAPFVALEMNWLGSLNKATNIITAWHTTPFKTYKDLFKREMIVAAAGATTDGVVYPKLMNKFLGTKFKIVAGYPGSATMDLAMTRGEVHGRGGVPYDNVASSHPDWLRDSKVVILYQLALKKHPALPDVPLLLDQIKDPDAKEVFRFLFSRQEMGRVFLAPPMVPADRLQALRAAFMTTATQAAKFIAEAKKQFLPLDVISGKEVESLIRAAYKTPKKTLDLIKATLKDKGGLARCSDYTEATRCKKKKRRKKKKG